MDPSHDSYQRLSLDHALTTAIAFEDEGRSVILWLLFIIHETTADLQSMPDGASELSAEPRRGPTYAKRWSAATSLVRDTIEPL